MWLSILLIMLGSKVSALGKDTCEETWTQILDTDSNGDVISGNKADLATALKHGARIRFQMTDTGYSGEVDFCSRVNTNDVCCQALQHVSKGGWETFQTNAYWWFINICTTGNYHMTRYNVGGGHLSDTRTTGDFRWFVTKHGDDRFPCPVYSSLANGTVVSGSLSDLVNSALKGNSIRVAGENNNGDLYPVDSVEASKGSCLDASRSAQVAVQNVWHVSQSSVGNHIEFQSNAYWWFVTLCASGSRDMSRWNLGSHVSRSHTQDTVQMNWFEDSCWKEVYQRDAIGNTKGSLQALRQEVALGHRVKVRLGDHFVEVDNVRLTQGQVSAQIISFLGKKDICTFEDHLHWELRVLSSSGTVRKYRPLVGEAPSQPLPETPTNEKITWFVDTRDWMLLLHISGSTVTGTPQAVKDAVNAGADIRVAIKLSSDRDFCYFKASNLAFGPGFDVAAQLIRVLGDTDAGNDEFELDPIPFWSFKIVTTNGDVRTTEWTLGAHTNRGRRTEKADVKWFAHV